MTTEEKRAYAREYYRRNKYLWQQYYKEHRQERLEYQAEYYGEHKEEIIAKRALAPQRMTEEERKAKRAAYKASRKAETKAYFRQWYLKNKEALSIKRHEQWKAKKAGE